VSTRSFFRLLKYKFASVLAFTALWGLGITGTQAGIFSLQGPGVDTNDFRITVFASGLSFPVGMVQLADGSLLVAVTQGTSYNRANAVGQIIRLTDTNQDGVADGPGTVVYDGLPNARTALRMFGNLIFVTGQGQPIEVLRSGSTPAAPLSLVGTININYPPGSWEHGNSALAVRPTPGQPGSCDLLFQIGSDENLAQTTRTAGLSSAQIAGVDGTLQGATIYSITLTDNLTNVVASNLSLVAKGLRNAAGMAFHPVTGDLYFNDNGMDGLTNANEPLSADVLDTIPAAWLTNRAVPDFGFPASYTEYRTGRLVGGDRVLPLLAFEPLPDPFTGSESEGPNEMAFAPPAFPAPLNHGLFVGFHGKWGSAGITNEENPVVYVDLTATNYFQIISNDEPAIGHLDGLLSTHDSLFLADFTSTGNPGGSVNAGVIYQIKSLLTQTLSAQLGPNGLQLTWFCGGSLQAGTSLTGPWTTIAVGTSSNSITVEPDQPQTFYRIQY